MSWDIVEQARAITIARLGALFAHVISVDDMIQQLRRAGQPSG